MKLIDELVARGEAAEQRAGQIADKEQAALDRRKAYGAIEREFESMAADGYLDRGELSKLMAEFRAAGLDTSSLDALARELNGRNSTGRIPVTAELRDKLGEQIQFARQETSSGDFFFEAQELMAEHQHSFDTASRVSKGEHEIYMTAIRHLAC